MKRAIVGYSGLVGSNLLQFYKFDNFYNSKNFHEAKNIEFDELFFCGIPAVKWYANKNPEEDTTIIDSIKSILKTMKIKKIILISTIDVYEYTDSENNEDYDCDFCNNHTYGSNRYLFEIFIKNTFDDFHIIRLPGLFGKGLKKNIIYDLINNNNIESISKDSIFQWYDLNWLKNDIDIILKNNIQICNLFTEPITSFEIIKLFNYPIENFKNNSKIVYNIKTKYSNLFLSNKNGYIRDKESVLHNLKIFIKFQGIDKTNLVVSNICVNYISQFQFSCILKLFGIKNVQIAPTKLIDNWNNLQNINIDTFKDNDINIYSFQSVTYGLDSNIFDYESRQSLMDHLKKIINYGILNNIKIIVFGCPRNRKILNKNDNNDTIFCEFFNELGNYIGENDLKICIEPNSKQYGCNFLNNIKETGDIVRKTDNKNIKLMVDIGNIIMENDDISKIYNYKDILYNIDIACVNMEPFITNNITNKHNEFIKNLKKTNYDKKMNLEMIIRNNDDELNILIQSLNNFILL